MRPEVRLFKEIHEIGGCNAIEDYSRGWDEAVALCERFVTEIFDVDYDDVEEEELYSAETRDDPVNHPSHYCDGGIETLDFILAKKLDFLTGQVCKYISRAGKKNPDKEIEDLKKARFYLNRKIQELEKADRTEGRQSHD